MCLRLRQSKTETENQCGSSLSASVGRRTTATRLRPSKSRMLPAFRSLVRRLEGGLPDVQSWDPPHPSPSACSDDEGRYVVPANRLLLHRIVGAQRRAVSEFSFGFWAVEKRTCGLTSIRAAAAFLQMVVFAARALDGEPVVVKQTNRCGSAQEIDYLVMLGI